MIFVIQHKYSRIFRLVGVVLIILHFGKVTYRVVNRDNFEIRKKKCYCLLRTTQWTPLKSWSAQNGKRGLILSSGDHWSENTHTRTHISLRIQMGQILFYVASFITDRRNPKNTAAVSPHLAKFSDKRRGRGYAKLW